MQSGPTRDSTKKASNYEVIIAGATAGVVSRFFIAPLDVIKIRLQLQPYSYRSLPGSIPGAPVYMGAGATLKSILKEEGLTALWKGNIPAELLYLTYGATQFFTYRQTHLLISTLPITLPDALCSSIAGATAGAIATTATYPFDLLRTRFAASGAGKKVYTNIFQAFNQIYITEGPHGFFRGLGAGVAQIVPHMALFFASYETIRSSLLLSTSTTGWEDATAGVVSGVIAKTGVFPLDTVRKRLQVQGPTRTAYVRGDIPVYKGITRSIRDIIGREGWRGLYKGLTVGLFKSAPASAVTMWTFERTMKFMRWLEDKEVEA